MIKINFFIFSGDVVIIGQLICIAHMSKELVETDPFI
jgi:predicted RecA/RadA family phage recombinase